MPDVPTGILRLLILPSLRAQKPVEAKSVHSVLLSPIMSRYAATFKEMVHQGTELKKRKHTNPNPKRPDSTPYRDIKSQNEWLRANVFDSMGNYTCTAVPVSVALWASQSKELLVKGELNESQSQHPVIEMSKTEVEEKRLGAYVVMPDGIEIAFKTWWRSLVPVTVVRVRYPHDRHGNAGKPSHSAKGTVLQDFLSFTDINS